MWWTRCKKRQSPAQQRPDGGACQKIFLTRWWTGKQAPPPRPPSPVSAKILRIFGRGNCKEAIFALENRIFRRKNRPAPAVHAAGDDFKGRALRGWRFADVVCEPKPRPGTGQNEDMKGFWPPSIFLEQPVSWARYSARMRASRRSRSASSPRRWAIRAGYR